MPQLYSNVSEVPLALAVFLASDNYDHDDDPNTISATTLLRPVRQIILSPRVPAGISLPKLGDMLKNRMGAAIHDGIERAWKFNHENALRAIGIPDRVIDKVKINPEKEDLDEDTIPIYMEQRLSRTLGKWKVTGKFDFVGEGRVQDFKSTSVFTYKNQVNANKYALQGSIYRWLDPNMITDSQMDIHYIFTDWKAGMVNSDPSYPKKMFLTQTFDLKPIPETAAYISSKLKAIEEFWYANEADIPYCDDEDLWRSEPIYKYYKNGDVTAKRSTKNFATYQEAVIHMSNSGGVGAIKAVPGQVVACKYCPAFAACTQKDLLIASGDLILE